MFADCSFKTEALTQPPRPSTVVVIDDDSTFVEMATEVLQTESRRVLGASDLHSGLAVVLKHQPQVLVLDRFVGPDDGLVIIETVRRLSPGTKVMVLSGWVNFGTLITALSNGADDQVLKPVSCGELRSRIDALVY
jgi:ATP-dependent Lon protease